MKKITELTETKWRTTHYRDEYGNLVKDSREYEGYRDVQSAPCTSRLLHSMVDGMCIMVCFILFKGVYFLLIYQFRIHLFNIIGFFFSLFILMLVIHLVYYVLFEYYWQRTPGKFITKSVVINEYGNRPDLLTIIHRTLIRMVPYDATSFNGVPCRGWHDTWSKTWVVSKEELAEIKKLQQEQAA